MSHGNEKTLIRIAICDDNMRLCSDIEKCIFDYRENSQEFYDVEICIFHLSSALFPGIQST